MSERGRPHLPGALLQRLAERFAAPAARERVLLPIVADLQHEWQVASNAGRRLLARIRGTSAFARACAPVLLRYAAGEAWRGVSIWSPEDGQAARRLWRGVGLATVILTAVNLMDGIRWHLSRGLLEATPLLVPSILSTALPVAGLLGVALSAASARASTRWRPLLGTALALVTFLVAGWLTPNSNQAYRQRVFAAVAHQAGQVVPGDRELTLPELRARQAELVRQGEAREADRLAVEWHKKPALAASCLTLALVGVALARAFRRRVVRVLAVLAVMNLEYGLLRLGERAADSGGLSPALAMWGPVIAVLALAATLPVLTRGRRLEHADP